MQRDLKLDGIKFVLIVLVVLGHLEYVDYRLGVPRLIYAFHMPAFVFLSGYFTSTNQGLAQRIGWVFKTLWLYFLLQWMDCVFFHFTGHEVSIKHLVGTWPLFAAWYLLSLVCWRLLFWITFSRVNGKLLFVASIIMAALSGWLPVSREFAIQQTFTFLPYFIFGSLARNTSIMSKIYGIDLRLSCLVLILCCIIARLLPVFSPVNPFADVWGMLLRGASLLLGFVMTFAFISAIIRLPVERLAVVGKYTLWIYLGHAIPVLCFNYYLRKFGVSVNVAVAFSFAVVLSMIISLLEKFSCEKLRSR